MKSRQHLLDFLTIASLLPDEHQIFLSERLVSEGGTPLKYKARFFSAAFETSIEEGHMISISVFLFLMTSGVILAVRNKRSVNDRTKMCFQFV